MREGHHLTTSQTSQSLHSHTGGSIRSFSLSCYSADPARRARRSAFKDCLRRARRSATAAARPSMNMAAHTEKEAEEDDNIMAQSLRASRLLRALRRDMGTSALATAALQQRPCQTLYRGSAADPSGAVTSTLMSAIVNAPARQVAPSSTRHTVQGPCDCGCVPDIMSLHEAAAARQRARQPANEQTAVATTLPSNAPAISRASAFAAFELALECEE
jgi:hypothetical protein